MGGVSIISGTLSSVSGTISDLDNPIQSLYSLPIIIIHQLMYIVNIDI
ncbi:hypothetical protein DesyoDRAFT_3558 [Desulfosporosinus youngiae DSM 17734]|uniref:Uncharacterized protein n=1 Tax=Desulfosporosinus youngiae DSM 17734 TaxID=768710 RepID=H5Y5H6_9FIRM|nr:hypothetical protein DesyoDRAFT_3558 [Desulfosporosinus youngiae DSM 17734]